MLKTRRLALAFGKLALHQSMPQAWASAGSPLEHVEAAQSLGHSSDRSGRPYQALAFDIGDPRPLSRRGRDGPRPLGHRAVRERRALRDTRDVRHQPRNPWLELVGQFEAVGCEILRRRAG